MHRRRHIVISVLAAFALLGAALVRAQSPEPRKPVPDFMRQAEEQARLRAEAHSAACALPKPSETARVILMAAPDGDALSTVALQSQDVAVTTGKLLVEAGDTPLYVIVRGHGPTIWRVAGAAERVERLVIASSVTGPSRSELGQVPLAGVTGVAAERVTFLGRPDCIQSFTVPSMGALDAVEKVQAMIGRRPVPTAVFGEGSTVGVPSGERAGLDRERLEFIIRDIDGMPRIERGPNRAGTDWRDLQAALRRFYPGGIFEIDPATVIANAPVVRYITLPQEAGLLQLVQSGALSENKPANPRHKWEYVVRRPIRYPAGLHGSHFVKFVIARGVPMPEGNPGQSCVVMEETGQPVINPNICPLVTQ